MKLFAVYMGGKHAGSSIEAHDVLFVAAESLQASAPLLHDAWFGVKSSAHVDSWIELTHVENFLINLSPDKPKRGEPKFYFVNIGSSRLGRFGENHDFYFLVARTKIEAKEKARAFFSSDKSPHVDDICDIDASLLKVGEMELHVRLVERSAEQIGEQLGALEVHNVYLPLWRLLPGAKA